MNLTTPQRTFLAKCVYTTSSFLGLIKTPRQTYEMSNEVAWMSGETDACEFSKAGWHWLPCQTSLKLLQWSMRLDEAHWDHWALVHQNCRGIYCIGCKGRVCGD